MNPDELNTIINTEDFVDEYSVALDSVPPEVRRFMWSEAFSLILRAIGDTYKLNDNQREVLKRVVMETLVGTITPISRRTRLADVGIIGETQDKVLRAIDDEVVSRALIQIEDYNELHNSEDAVEDNGQQAATIAAPTPAQALASIKERLSQTSTIAPTKRDYSVERAETPASPTQNTSKPVFDIYREPPTK